MFVSRVDVMVSGRAPPGGHLASFVGLVLDGEAESGKAVRNPLTYALKPPTPRGSSGRIGVVHVHDVVLGEEFLPRGQRHLGCDEVGVDASMPAGAPSQPPGSITRPSSRMSLSILAKPLGSATNVSPSNDTKGTSALTEFIATTA